MAPSRRHRWSAVSGGRAVILVTVGAQMPFDRLVLAVDHWARDHGIQDVFAQIGDGGQEPEFITWTRFLEPDEFRRRLEAADVLVAHAGTGSILNACELGKPVLVLPRHASKNETRNDHQIATARRFEEMGHVQVAWDEDELRARLEDFRSQSAAPCIPAAASPELIAALAEFVAMV